MTDSQLPLVPAGRYLVVGLEDGMHHSRVAGIFANINLLPGVTFVADLSVISRLTLDEWLLPASKTLRNGRQSRRG